MFDELFYGIMKIMNLKLSELENEFDMKYKMKYKMKYDRKYDIKYDRKYDNKYKRIYERKCKSFKAALLEQKIEQIRILENEIAELKSKLPTADKSIFIKEIAILCRDILFD